MSYTVAGKLCTSVTSVAPWVLCILFRVFLLQDLLSEAKAQLEIQHEAYKALKVCEQTGRPSFDSAEAERLILLSGTCTVTVKKNNNMKYILIITTPKN